MAQNKVKQAIITGSAALGLLILVIVGVIVIRSMINSGDDTRYEQSNIENKPVQDPPKEDEQEPAVDEKPVEEEPQLDPASLSTITITQMGIEVSYLKGIGGFEYAIKRTPGGSQYVEFKSEQLKGTKCTDDQGVFVSIVEKPDANETAILSKRKSVGGVEYGLSLAATNCTSDEVLLKKYQDSFTKAFGLLKSSSAIQE